MYTRRRRTPPHGRSAIVQTQLAYAFVHGVRQLSVRKLDFIPIYTTHSRGYAVTRTGRRRRREGFASSRARRGQGWNGNANGSKHYTDGRRRGPSCVHPERIIKRYKRLCLMFRQTPRALDVTHDTAPSGPVRRSDVPPSSPLPSMPSAPPPLLGLLAHSHTPSSREPDEPPRCHRACHGCRATQFTRNTAILITSTTRSTCRVRCCPRPLSPVCRRFPFENPSCDRGAGPGATSE
jgi:hypothetical protein